jgi:hypothetical protein
MYTVDYKEGPSPGLYEWDLAVNYPGNIMPTTQNIAAAFRAAIEADQKKLTLADYERVAEMVKKWEARYRRAFWKKPSPPRGHRP